MKILKEAALYICSFEYSILLPIIILNTKERKEQAVAQLVEALRYKPEGRGIDSRLCHWNFSLT
jgi:hypothetical protein